MSSVLGRGLVALIGSFLLSVAAWAVPPQTVGSQTQDEGNSGTFDPVRIEQTSGPYRISANLSGPPRVGANVLTISLKDPNGDPVKGTKLILTVAMATMDMGVSHPEVRDNGDGTYTAQVEFSMAGPWRVSVKAGDETLSFDFSAGASSMPGMEMGAMAGRLGSWPMSKEGSGTSWLPESSPMFMKMLPKSGRYDLSNKGFITFNYSDSGGTRGDHRFYSNSMIMLMADRQTGGGRLGLDLMVSLDPIFNGEWGYPDLFQTGETAHGTPLVDWQHPHDLLSEAAATYSHPIGDGFNAFVYGGPVGEPCLGGPAFMHRPSGEEIPEAPITHHWFDSTHISWGVLTLGVNDPRWQLEGSVFNGHEPNENRYLPDPIGLNSASARLTFNPTRNLSFNTSYGFLNSPESTMPGVDQHRVTGIGIWSLPVGHNNLSVSALYGEIIQQGRSLPAYLVEATYLTGPTSIFARWENVDKDELIGLPAGTYNVNKVLFGGVRNVAARRGYDLGIGAYAGVYAFPQSVEPFYGHPLTLGAFVRIRPNRMQ